MEHWIYNLGDQKLENIDTATFERIKTALAAHDSLVEAIKEALCWMQGGRPIDYGSKCETNTEAVSKLRSALALAGVK